MNILLVTQNMQDARLIEHELEKRIPGLNIVTTPEAQHAIGRLASPGGFSAVLLDTMLHEGDSLSVIRAVRAQSSPIAVIGLVGDANPDSGAKLVGSGADDYVIKDAGFVDSLARLLRRASAGTPRVLYAIGGAASTGVLAKNSLKPDTAGATRVLVRNNESVAARKYATLVDAAREAMHQGEPLSRQVEEDAQAAEHRSWELKRLELEQRQQSAEEEMSRLQLALRAAQTALDEPSRLFQNEKEKLQSEWERFGNQLEDAKAQEKGMEEALHIEPGRESETVERQEEEFQKSLLLEHDIEQHMQPTGKERVQWLEALREIKNQVVSKTEELRSERERWNLFRLAMNQQLVELEGRRARLQRAVLEGGQPLHADRILHSENAQNAEAENPSLRDSLQAAEGRVPAQFQQHRVEKDQRESARLEMEQQTRGLQERIAQLEEANARLALERRELLAQLEALRFELEPPASDLADELRRIIERHNDLVGKHRSDLGVQ